MFIDLREGSLGPQAIVAGIGVGIGDYKTGKGEHGYFVYAGGGIVGFDFSVGFGLSDSAIQALVSPPAY